MSVMRIFGRRRIVIALAAAAALVLAANAAVLLGGSEKKLEGPAVPSKAAVKAAADGSLKLQLPKNSKLVPLKQVQIEK